MNELREAIFDLLKKAPRPERIASTQQTRAFKAAADAAKKAALAGKPTLGRLQSSLNELRMYYE